MAHAYRIFEPFGVLQQFKMEFPIEHFETPPTRVLVYPMLRQQR